MALTDTFTKNTKHSEPAPDGGGPQAHVFADLPYAQALGFDHLNDLQFEAGVKDSSEFRMVHVSCRFTFDNLSLCLFKLDHHTPCSLQSMALL